MVGKEEARRHRRGEGSTYRVADGGWMAQLSLGTDRRTGKRRTVRRRAPDAKSAERALLRLQREWGIAGEVAWTKLSDYLADWLDDVKPSIAPATFTSYSGHVENHIDPLIGHLPVGSLRPTDVHRLIARLLEQDKSAATVQRIVTTLRMALGQAVRDGELTVNVAQVKLPRVDRPPVEAMTDAQAQALIVAVKDDTFETLYTVLLGTGMRLGEACALDWRDVDLKHGTVFVRQGQDASCHAHHHAPRVRGSLPAPAPRQGGSLRSSGARLPRSPDQRAAAPRHRHRTPSRGC